MDYKIPTSDRKINHNLNSIEGYELSQKVTLVQHIFLNKDSISFKGKKFPELEDYGYFTQDDNAPNVSQHSSQGLGVGIY